MSSTVWVKVDTEVVDNLWRAMSGISHKEIASALAYSAMYHVAVIKESIPDVAAEKITVSINEAGDNFIVTYRPRAGTEGGTITTSKTFIPTTSTSDPSRVQEPIRWDPEMAGIRSGAEGYFLAGLKVMGRPSLEAFAMAAVQKALPGANEIVAAAAAEKAKDDIKLYFERHGIKFNEALGRWQAPAGYTPLPWGGVAGPGQIIVGEF